MSNKEMYIPSVRAAVKLIIQYYNNEDYGSLRNVKQYLENSNVSKYIAGDADSFHNATVQLTRIGFYDYAYALAEVGLHRYPKNTDLLGDLLCYGLQCRDLVELEKWYLRLKDIPRKFWSWRAYQFSFDYWMERLPESNEEQLPVLEKRIEEIFSSFHDNFRFLRDKSDCEKAFVMKYEYFAAMGQEEDAVKALIEATEDPQTANKCPQCALRLADLYFEKGDYTKSYLYADLAVNIKEDQPSIKLGYVHYIRAMSLEYNSRQKKSTKQDIKDIFDAYYSALLYLKEEDGRENLISSTKKQVKMLEREFNVDSKISFEEYDTSEIMRIINSIKTKPSLINATE